MKDFVGGDTHAAQKREKGTNVEPSRVQAEAFWAEPFGVARVNLALPPLSLPLGLESLVVSSPQGRVFYPAIEEGLLRALVREKTGLAGGRYTLYFLFTGKDPLEVRIRSLQDSWTVRLVPGEHPRRWSRLLADWQEVFSRRPGRSDADDPLGVEKYLSTMLARRLGLDKSDASEGGRLRRRSEPDTPLEQNQAAENSGLRSFLGPELGWLFGVESLRAEMLQERIEGRSRRWRQPAENPLPEIPSRIPHNQAPFPPRETARLSPPRERPVERNARPGEGEMLEKGREHKAEGGTLLSPSPTPLLPGERETQPPQIELLASRVPEECFYIRFGGMANFAWFREFLDWSSQQWTMCVAGKGLDYQLVQRSEERLCLRPTGWSRLLGRQMGAQVENLAVADVALIGLDLFQRDGSGLGVLFQARSEALLRAELERQRSEALRTGQGNVREEKVPIGGQEVSLLTSKDGRIRSFYVVDGPWHLVCTSRRLAERFLQTRSGQGALANAADFRAIRAKYPPKAEQTAFWYFSDAFWRTLFSPAYQVEMRRRAQAEADILLLEMARQAALAEGRPAETIDVLAAQGFLPPEFGSRSDGSQAVLKNGQVWDSLRGRRGYFTPIADVEVSRLSDAELQGVEEYLRSVSTAQNRLSPIGIVFRRTEPEKEREQISMEIYTYPLQSAVLETLSRFFGAASSERIAPPPGDTAFTEWRLPQGRLFLGLRAEQPAEVRFGRGKLLLELVPPGPQLLLQALRVGYVGRQGETPFLEMLEKLLAGRPDQEGYTGRPGGLWRREIGPLVLYSFDRQILADIGPLLRLEHTDQPAQVRVQIKDPADSPLGQWFHQLAYQQAQEAALANLRLLTRLENQFHLSGQAALETAQQWHQARLVCPLGGRYEYRDFGRGGGRWVAAGLAEAGALADQPAPANTDTPQPGILPSLPGEGSTQAKGEGSVQPQAVSPPPLDWFRGLEGYARWQNKEIQISISLLRQKKVVPPASAKPSDASR